LDLDRLLVLPAGRQQLVIASIHPVRRKLLVGEAYERTVAERRNDARGVAALAELTVRLADAAGEELLAARARLELANAYRRLGRFAAAETSIAAAEPALRHSGSGLDRTRRALFLASLDLNRGRCRRAVETLAQLDRPSDDNLELVAWWTMLGIAHRTVGDIRRAQQAQWRAVQITELFEAPLHFFCAATNLATIFAHTGEPEAAITLLDRLAPLNATIASDNDRFNFSWLKARALAADGAREAASEHLRTLSAAALRDHDRRPGEALQVALDTIVLVDEHEADIAPLLDELLAAVEDGSHLKRLVRPMRLLRHLTDRRRRAYLRRLQAAPAMRDPFNHAWLDPAAAQRHAREIGVERPT
jgi:tetratricopeptide (TPR) repeat protein